MACKISEIRVGLEIKLEIGLQEINIADVRGGYERGCWVYVYMI